MRPHLSIAAQLIIPFVAILLFTTMVLGITRSIAMNKVFSDALDTESRLITRYLSNELADPLSMGEYDRMKSILTSAQKLDECFYYAVAVAADGRVLATTDPSVKNIRLNRDEFERSAISSRDFLRRETRYANVFETVMPIKSSNGETGGVLRIGFSRKAAHDSIYAAVINVFIIGAITLFSGMGIYILVIRKSIIHPITRMAHLATKIAEGDLSNTVETTRADEIGQLLKAQAEMVRCLREIAKVAESIADGDLSVDVDVHSDKDVFGKVLEKMVASLRRQTKKATQLAAIVEYSEDAIFSITGGGEIISWNKGAQKLFGYQVDDIVGQSVEVLLLQDERETFFDAVGKVFNDKPLEPYETIQVRQDGSLLDIALSVSPVKTDADQVMAVSLIARDITHRKAVEKRMREFYSIVSHELRTPLTSIRGALGLLAGGVVEAGSEDGVMLIETAKSSSERLGRLIDDILDLRKIESGNLELNIENVDSSELATQAVATMRAMAQHRSVTLSEDFRHRFNLAADKDRSTQVLVNLISNAIKYSEAGDTVHVSTAPSEKLGLMRFSIVDRGQGIPEEARHKLFKNFQQVDSSDTRAKEGSGLGLAISKAIVEQHGGTIDFDSVVGSGSTFWFELPVLAVLADFSPAVLATPILEK